MRLPSFARVRSMVARSFATSAVIVLGTSVVATPSRPEPTVRERVTTVAITAARGGSRSAVATGLGAEMVGLSWDGGGPATVRVRAMTSGRWSEWLVLEGSSDEGPDVGADEYHGSHSAGPAWIGHDVGSIELEVVDGAPENLRVHAIDTETPTADGAFGSFGLSSAGASTPVPGIITRAQWGADESYRTLNCDGKPDYASDVRRAIVHHTVNSNDYLPSDSAALMRSIYFFHTHTNGWCDIGYNFLIDRYGQVFEGRFGGIHRPVIGGHSSGFNTGSTGVALIGNFQEGDVPPAAYGALRTLLAWKLAYHGVDPLGQTVVTTLENSSARWPAGTGVLIDNLGGHRDTNYTTCPGAYLYALLPQLRADVARSIEEHRDQRLVCDWDGDGTDTPAWFENGYWYIRNSNKEGFAELVVHYGVGSWTAVCGDWNGDGVDTIGMYTQGRWLLRNANSGGAPDLVFDYGAAGYQPVVGDWDGLLGDSIGVYVSGRWLIRNLNLAGFPDLVVEYGAAGYKPVTGDWNGDGIDGIGIFVNGAWRLRNTASAGQAQISANGYGLASDGPVAGDWDGADGASIGVSRGAYWFLRDNLISGYANHVFPY